MTIRADYIKAHGEIPDAFEVHHLIPKRLGGNDDITNLVAVSKLDHQKLHLMLFYLFDDFRDMCATHMIGYNFTEAQLISSSVGGIIGGNKCKEAKVGVCNLDDPRRPSWAALGGTAAQAILKERKVSAYYDPELKKIISSVGGKKGAFTMSHIQSELGKRGGVKNKGAICITNGVLNKKYTTRLHSILTFTEFLEDHVGWWLGRTQPARKSSKLVIEERHVDE